jgi:predicted Zn finger-like uncharacterized protein
MLIVCPSCATSYDVKSASLPPDGRQVRCLRCQTVWHAEPSQADKLLAAVAAIAPDRGLAEGADAVAAAATAQSAGAPSAAAVRGGAGSDQSADRPSDHEQPAGGASLAAATDDQSGPASAAAANDMSFAQPSESAKVEAPPLVPVDLDAGRPPIDIDADRSIAQRAEPAEDVETVAARRQRRSATRRSPRWPLSRLHSGILALVLIDAVLIGWRSDIVWALPQTASFYALMGVPVNLRGLSFDGVVTTTEQHESVPILVVEGNVVNTGRKIVDVPRLKFVVRNAARQEIYSWTAVPSRTLLPPGEAVAFRTRLASPPPDAHDLILRFVNRRDLIAGTH